MDVKSCLGGVLIPLFSLAIAACDKSPRNIDLLNNQKLGSSCPSQVIKNEFIVKWKTGKITRHKKIDREEFINNILNKNENKISAVEPSYKMKLLNRELKPMASCSQTDWGQKRIEVEKFWNQNITGKDVIIAVTDSGLDINHPAIKESIAYNKGELGLDENGESKKSNGIDDDQNGYIDDFAGFDFIYNKSVPEDTVKHGTWVAGVIASNHEAFGKEDDEDPGFIVKGIAPGAKILPLKFIDNENGGTADAIEAIDYAIQQGAKIINASWGGNDCSDILPNYMASLNEKEILFVAASGNGDWQGKGFNLDDLGVNLAIYPASINLKNQITVGAIGSFGNRARFSNYGPDSVEMFAPGASIFTISPKESVVCVDGTSFAAPMVSGALALLMEAYPDASHLEIKKLLLDSVEKDEAYINLTNGSLHLGDLAP